jgi:serine/threonine protein kinase
MANLSLEAVARAICDAAGYTFGGGIAEGAFKETFLATKVDGTKLALKILKPGYSPERTDREVEAMKRCAHPNIAALIDLAAFDHGGAQYVYLAETFLGGGTLEDRLKKGLLDRDSFLALGEELISAVGHIANHHLVHRDLKPPNIMFRASDAAAPVIVDFGIVRDLRKDSITLSFVAMGPGTPFFAAPEQLNNDKALIDWRTDQFALGVTLALCHFGNHPFAEPGDTVIETINRVSARTGPSQTFIDSATNSKLYVITKMVSAWPADRIRTSELLLEKWRAERGK